MKYTTGSSESSHWSIFRPSTSTKLLRIATAVESTGTVGNTSLGVGVDYIYIYIFINNL